jgi:hypothetical protein
VAWVRSEYAGELAVLSAWLAALVPWNVTYSPDVLGGSLLFVRFPFLQVRFAFGVGAVAPVSLADPVTAFVAQRGTTAAVAYLAWLVGAAVVLLAVGLSVAYYAREDRVEAGPVDPVRLMGGLLVAGGVALGAATVLFVTRGIPGLPVPLGVLAELALGAALLRVERT